MTQLPTVPFGPHRVTRLIVGGNPFCGNSHFSAAKSREMAAYYTAEQVVQVLQRCEQAGINTVQARGDYHRVLYWIELFRRGGGRLHWMGIYHHGTQTDRFWQAGEIDKVEDYLKCMRDCGVQVGLGTHIPEVIAYAEERDWDVDFYMACVYNLSRKPRESALVSGVHAFAQEEYLDEDRERMCETIRQTDKTCLAFKILAAGRHCGTQEEVGQAFQYAFDQIKAQDAVVVGMYPKEEDQVALNVAHTLRALGLNAGREEEKEVSDAAV
jgi:hypothetical protein